MVVSKRGERSLGEAERGRPEGPVDLSYFVRKRTNIVWLFYYLGRVPLEQPKRDINEEVSS